ncbi:Wzz/FepE/Etk N-terminal domain-containing protein [Microbacterium gilvum]|uniref:Polysaccharide biosynthesis tyrosine autokinase n=1 Tax=Microbacterium gilvum TaxID=1336204 RepID=A0ABP9A9M2_9MICO
MPLKQIQRILRRNLWIIVVVTLLGGAVGYAQASTQPDTYTATSQTLFTPVTSSGQAADMVSTSGLIGSQLATFAALVGTPLILDPVIDDLGLGADAAEVAGTVTASVANTNNILIVTATSTQPQAAARLADAVSQSIVDEVLSGGGETEMLLGAQIQAELVAPGETAVVPAGSVVIITVLVGAAVGFAIALLVSGLRAQTDRRVRTRDDVRRAVGTELPVEGVVRDGRLLVREAPDGPVAEANRRLVSEIVARAEGVPSLLVTSPRPTSGTPASAANIAAAIAESGSRVVLVDADLRTGETGALFGLEAARGLSTVLQGGTALDEAVVDGPIAGLRILPSGPAASNASALISSGALDTVMRSLDDAADVLVIAAPAVLEHADAARLARYADGSVVVVTSGDADRGELAEAADLLAEAGAAPAAAVIADVPRRGVDAAWR